MALAAATRVTAAGITDSLSAPLATDSVAYPSNPRGVWMEVNNASAGSVTVTVASQATAADGLAQSDKSVAVGAGLRKSFEISEAFKDSNGDINFTFSAVTSVTADVFYL
jgi:hypothetical protein